MRSLARRGRAVASLTAVLAGAATLVGCGGGASAVPTVTVAGAHRDASTTAPTTTQPTGRATTTTVPSTATTTKGAGVADTGWAQALRAAHASQPPVVAAQYGIAVAGGAPGARVVLTLGAWRTGPAWSTIKVPLTQAVMHASGSTVATADMRAALTVSDNAAAARLWQALGSGNTAAGRVDAVLSAHDNPDVSTQPQVTRPGFSASGQTQWSVGDQAAFAAALACRQDAADGPVLDLLGQVDPSQHWGAGRWPGARFKGGWGPSPSGAYLARQLALLPHDGGWSAVALAATARDGSFGSATAALSELERWLAAHTDQLPLVDCTGQ